MRAQKHEARRIAEFSLVGALVALLSFFQLWLYIDVLNIHIGLAYVLQTIVSIEINYIGNYFLAWRDRRHEVRILKSHLIFWSTRGVMTLINPFIFIALAATGINYLLAQAIILFVNMFINYFTSDKLVFRKPKKEYISHA